MPKGGGLEGLTVLAFESRRAQELAKLIQHYGGRALSAPSMREVATASKEELRSYLATLERGGIDVVVLLTGVGVRFLVAQVEPELSAREVAAALRHAVLVARGPKPVAALRGLGLSPDYIVPSPHTWRELLELMEREHLLTGKTVAVQEYGIPNHELLRGLASKGARVVRVPLYQWDRPSDVEALRAGVEAALSGRVEIVIFTSANQVHAVFDFVQEELPERAQAWNRALRSSVVASVGPVCSSALRAHGIEPDLEADPPRMGPLVQLVAEHGRRLWATKNQA